MNSTKLILKNCVLIKNILRYTLLNIIKDDNVIMNRLKNTWISHFTKFGHNRNTTFFNLRNSDL